MKTEPFFISKGLCNPEKNSGTDKHQEILENLFL